MTSISRLRPLLLAGGEHTQLIVSGQPVSANQLRDSALALAAVLAPRPEQRWAVWLQNSGDFLVTFMALALAGKTLCLPGQMQPASAGALSRHFDALISRQHFDQLACPCFTPEQLLASPSGDLPTDTAAPVDVVLFTSGSTGEPRAIHKTLALLEQELHIQQRFAGERLGRLPVLSTVSHQHIYGLLHGVLWPLLRRAPIVEGLFQYPEELLAAALPLAPVVLLSSPTHLKRLPENPAFRQHQGAIGEIISSGGLLDEAAAQALHQLMGYAPLEILGSTETGGVAWRRQSAGSHWQPLPQVECRVDPDSGCLAVNSPHLGEAGPFVMGDRVTFQADGGFVLQGRADRLLKVEGKRVSATGMEHCLAEHPWVEAAVILLLEGRREAVAAAVILSKAGREMLADKGKLAVNRQLRDHLLGNFERPVLPRRWRYPAEFPLNTQGKRLMADITALFDREEPSR